MPEDDQHRAMVIRLGHQLAMLPFLSEQALASGAFNLQVVDATMW